ncbi:MAG: alanine racemase, partial [Acidimicrobiales bacterium]
EHVTLVPGDTARPFRVGDKVRLRTAHIDPTIAKHEAMWVADGDEIIDRWPVDLRGW